MREPAANEFEDRLKIRHNPVNENLGRCIVANCDIVLARGEYINFLGEDDDLFSEHVEVMANEIDMIFDNITAIQSVVFQNSLYVKGSLFWLPLFQPMFGFASSLLPPNATKDAYFFGF